MDSRRKGHSAPCGDHGRGTCFGMFPFAWERGQTLCVNEEFGGDGDATDGGSSSTATERGGSEAVAGMVALSRLGILDGTDGSSRHASGSGAGVRWLAVLWWAGQGAACDRAMLSAAGVRRWRVPNLHLAAHCRKHSGAGHALASTAACWGGLPIRTPAAIFTTG